MANYDRAPVEYVAGKSAAVGISFVNRVFMWMAVGLGVTAAVSWFVARNFTEQIIAARGVFIVLLIAEVLLVIGLTAAINRISAAAATGGFLLYAALNGATLSVIFLVYSMSAISLAFFTACLTFGSVGLFGFITKRDLSGIGSLCGMALWGIIIAMVLNFFFHSTGLELFISCVGVIVFVGLTAYDTQKIKQLAVGVDGGQIDGETGKKYAVLGALTLYLDFINLFLMLLRLFGNRR
ncbi:MAG: Bax inhibitor-1/YccA family protein [Victivallaceae bacterium]|nr:Bax inhibitor-1/YccA family protein [Victivallaceae bacterium]